MKLNAKNQSLGVLRSLLLLVLIIFGVWILDERGLLAVVLEGDKSQISTVIGCLWIISSIYWLYLSKLISDERNSFENMEFKNKKLLVSRFFNSLEKNEDKDVLINAFESEFEKKISYGVVASDVALKLGLLGTIIGFISVPLGIGGGSLMVPFMRTFGYDIRKSIGTAAAVGFLIAVSGTITMITGGEIINNVNTPFSIGYINLLGFIVFVPVTMLMARIGAKAVYKINKKLLSKIFGIFLIIVSLRSFLEYLNIN